MPTAFATEIDIVDVQPGLTIEVHSVSSDGELEVFDPYQCGKPREVLSKSYQDLKKSEYNKCWVKRAAPLPSLDGYKVIQPSTVRLSEFFIFDRGKLFISVLNGIIGISNEADAIKKISVEVSHPEFLEACRRDSKLCLKNSVPGFRSFHFGASKALRRASRELWPYFLGKMGADDALKILKRYELQSLSNFPDVIKSGDYVCRNRLIKDFKIKLTVDERVVNILAGVVSCPPGIHALIRNTKTN